MEPRTHYQISLTARQAVGLFVTLLLALGLAFFFGLMTGLSGRERAAPAPEPVAAEERQPSEETASLPPIETAVPTARNASARPSAEPSSGALAPGAEPTAPSTLQTFEDGGGEETPPPAPNASPPASAAARPAAAARTPVPAKKPTPAGRVWVQVAAVSSRAEAEAASVRLTQHGYKTLILSEKGHFRVRVGPYRTTEDARRAAEKLRKQEKFKTPWVVFEGK